MHAEGQRFESVILHRKKRTDGSVCPEEEKEILMFEKSVGDWKRSEERKVMNAFTFGFKLFT